MIALSPFHYTAVAPRPVSAVVEYAVSRDALTSPRGDTLAGVLVESANTTLLPGEPEEYRGVGPCTTDDASKAFTIPSPEWTAADQKRFSRLAATFATGALSTTESAELRKLQVKRRHNHPGRSYEELLRAAKQDRLLNALKQSLNAYVTFLKI